jgi:hypothetical protein
MIRLSLRQFRSQGIVAAGLLVLVAILFATTGAHIAHIYDVYAKAQAACVASADCRNVDINLGTFERLLELIGTVLVAVPALVGAFWGAPLISREFENGTHRLAWTQSVTRTRWLAVKLGLVGVASVAATGLLSLMVTWWSSPIDHANMDRFGSGMFGQRNITPLGYAAFGFVLGVAAGLLIRRALPAMAATLGVFLGVRLGFTYLVRPYLLSPTHLSTPLSTVVHGYGSTNGGAESLFAEAVNLPNAWVYSTRLVDSSGRALSPAQVSAACPDLARPLVAPPVSVGNGGRVTITDSKDPLQACITKLSSTYHGVVTYQPANRYWTFQILETAIFLAAALALAGLCFYWIRRRV